MIEIILGIVIAYYAITLFIPAIILIVAYLAQSAVEVAKESPFYIVFAVVTTAFFVVSA